jgi:hypothetical protein
MFLHSSSRHVCCFATLAKIIALFLLVEVTAQRKVFILEHVVIYNEILNRILTYQFFVNRFFHATNIYKISRLLFQLHMWKKMRYQYHFIGEISMEPTI